MTQEATRDDITVRDGVIAGPIRQSVNASHDAKGSIHDDATATSLGFRGGTVAGSIHLNLFPPLLLKAFGPRWFERGTLSMYFLNATTDREPVRAFLKEPPGGAADIQVDAWVEREDGMRVAEGSASAGEPAQPTALQRRPLDRFEVGELRILQDVKPGDPLGEVGVIMSPEGQQRILANITERLPWYDGESPWGGAIVPPNGMVVMLYQQSVATLRGKLGSAVGLFGAIELRAINGPVHVDVPYTVTGSVLAVGQSPKSEYMWFETGLDDHDGARVAEMRMMLRWMKASSPLYQS
ncbi:MAG: hypothetical protein ACRDJE_21020 [Dehalococcoidia bacterium]